MGREYSKRRPSRARSSAPQQFLVLVVTFLLGYLTATVFDVETISRWVNTQVLAHHEQNKAPKSQAQQKAAIPPKPKFEFYTLLANEKAHPTQPAANSAASQAVAAKTPPATAVQTVAANAAVSSVKSNTSTVHQPAAVKIAEAKPVAVAVPVSRGAFSVQVASFKARQDAEHMKGLLTLKGFNVSVIPIYHANRGNWFRVVVGPYANRNLAQQAQGDLARNEHLRGMVTAG